MAANDSIEFLSGNALFVIVSITTFHTVTIRGNAYEKVLSFKTPYAPAYMEDVANTAQTDAPTVAQSTGPSCATSNEMTRSTRRYSIYLDVEPIPLWLLQNGDWSYNRFDAARFIKTDVLYWQAKKHKRFGDKVKVIPASSLQRRFNTGE